MDPTGCRNLGHGYSFDGEFLECRFRRRLGHFEEAFEKFEKLKDSPDISMDNKILVVVQIAWTRLLQGYFSESYKILHQWWLGYQENHHQSQVLCETGVLLELVMEFARVNCHGDPNRSVKAATAIFDKVLRHTEAKAYNYTLVQVESFYHRIMLFAAEVRVLDRKKVRALTSSRLQPLFDILCTAQRWEELLDTTNILALSLDWPANAELLKRVLNLQDLPALEKSLLNLEIGNLFESHNIYTTADNHFSIAEAGFRGLGHPYGELDIKMARSGRGSNFRIGDRGWQKALFEICSSYQEINFPVGMLRALQKYSEIAQQAEDFGLVYNSAKLSSEIAHETGSQFHQILFQITMLVATFKQSGHTSKLIESGLALIEVIRVFQTPYLEGTVASILSLSYTNLADNSQATKWAERATLASMGSNLSEQSFQEYLGAVARFTSHKPGIGQSIQYLEGICEHLRGSINRDIAAEIWDFCAKKLMLLSAVELAKYSTVSTLESMTEYEKCLQHGLEISEKLEETDRIEIIVSAQLLQTDGLLLRAKGDPGTENEQLAIRSLHSILGLQTLSLTPSQRASLYCQLGPPYWSIFSKTSNQKAPLDALDAFRNAYEIIEKFGTTEQHIAVMHGISWSLWLASPLDGFPRQNDMMLLSCFSTMEEWADSRRMELSAMGTLEDIRIKQSLLSDRHLKDLYSMSLEACIRLEWIEEGWHWVQKSKARSVSDLLGLGINIPKALLVPLQSNPIAVSLWQEERELQRTLCGLSPEKRLTFRREMEALHEKMESIDELRGVMAIRKGSATNLRNLGWAFDDKSLPTWNRSIVFVDWSTMYDGKELYMFVVGESRKPLHFHLNISVTQIKDWRESYFADNEMREDTLNEEDDDEDSSLRELDGLIDRLSLCSNPGDLLVLSPTGPLHSLPLHALRLPRDKSSTKTSMLLIERNPVIYCPSITILENCVLRARSRLEKSALRPPAIFAVYEPQPNDEEFFDWKERDAVYEHARNISQRFRSPTFCGAKVTKTVFSEHSAKTPLIHFHGHCKFDISDVLSQGLVLGDGNTTPSPQPDCPPVITLPNRPIQSRLQIVPEGSNPKPCNEFNVEDIFSLDLTNTHATLIACDSASQRISAGDEPLGIPTAFLCAGATSVLGTIWPTSTRQGRLFSEEFYGFLGNQKTEIGFFDYAEALQKAVLVIRRTRDGRLPYYWAPFILYGSWFGKSFDINEVNLG